MKYTYEIIKVDEAARVMEVVYTHPKHGLQHVGVRLPYEGENLTDLIRSAAPIAIWKAKEKPVFVPDVGVKGELDADPISNSSSNEVLL